MICKKLWKIIILVSLFVLVAGGLWGQATFTWTGAYTASPKAWGEAGNWKVGENSTLNTPGPGDDVVIPGSLSNYPETSNDIEINSLTIKENAILTLGGALTVTGDINNAGTIDIGSNSLTADSISGSGTVTTNGGSITVTASSSITTLTASGSVTLNGGSGLTVTNALVGSPNLTLSGTVTLGGAVGDVSANQDTLNLNGNLTATGAITNIGTIALGNSDHILSFASYTEGGFSSITAGNGTITSTNGTVLQTVSRVAFTSGSTTTLSGAAGGLAIADPIYNGTGIITTGTVSLPTGTIASLDVQAGTATVSGNLTMTGDLTVTGTIDADPGTLTFDGTADQTVNPGTHSIQTINIAKTGGSITFITNPLTVTTLTQGDTGAVGITFNQNLTVTNVVTFNTSGMLTFGDADTDEFIFNGGVSHTTGAHSRTTTLYGTLRTSDDAITLDNVILRSDSIIRSLDAAGAVVTVNGTITGGGNALALVSGSGTTTVSGDAQGLGAVTLQDATAAGTVSFNGIFEAVAITTFGGPHDISFTGDATTVTNAVTFNNTGNLILGDNAADVCTFNGGVTHTAGDTTLSGTLRTSDDAITLDNLTLGSTSVIRSLDAAAGAAIEVNGTITGGGNNLALISGSEAATVSGNATGLGAVTLQNATAAGTVSFDGNFEAAAITTFGGSHDISFTGNSTEVTNAVTFNNTGNLILGDNAADVCTFNGVTHTTGDTTLSGRLQTIGDAVTLQNLTVGTDSEISTGNGLIEINGTITGGGNALALVSGSGTTTVIGDAAGLGTVTLQDATAAGTVSFNGIFEAAAITTFGGPHDISFTGDATTVTNAVTFNNTGNLILGDNAADVCTFNGGVTHTAGDTTLSGTLRTSDDAITLDNLTLGSTSIIRSLDAVAGAAVTVNGSITGAGNDLTLISGTGTAAVSGDAQGLGAVTLQDATAAGTVSFNGIFEAAAITTFGGPHDISFTGDATTVTNAVTFNNTGNLILGDNAADDFVFDGGITHTAGVTTLSGTLRTSDDAITLDNLTLGSTSVIRSLDAAAGAAIEVNGTITGGGNALALVSGSGTTTVSGNASNLGTVTLQNATAAGIVSFAGSFEAETLTTYGGNHDISFTGNSTEVTNAVMFNNTGLVTLGNAVTDTLTFTGGITHTTGDTTLSGRLQTSGDAVTLQNLTIGTDSKIDSGTAIISIQGSTTGTSHNLTITGDVNFTGAVSGITTFDITGDADFAGTVGSVSTLTVTGNVEFNGAVTGTGTLEVSGTTAINTAAITTTGIQTYGGDVTLESNTTLTGSTVTFNEDIDGNGASNVTAHDLTITGTAIILGGACYDMGNVTITNSGNFILDDPAGITHIAGASFEQKGTGPNQLNGSITTSGTGSVSFATDLYLASSLTLGGGSDINCAADLFINAAGSTIIFNSDVEVQENIALFNGIVNMGADCSEIYALQDLILLNGNTASMYDDSDTGTADVFTYYHVGRSAAAPNNAGNTALPSLASFPPTMPDTTSINHSGTYESSFAPGALNGKTLSIGQNFYANGITFTAAAAPNNLKIWLDKDTGNAMTAFAESYNCTFTNVTANYAVAASENYPDGGGNTNIAFSRPSLMVNNPGPAAFSEGSGTYTVYDDVIRLEFADSLTGLPINIENTNNEIGKAVQHITTNNGGFAFTGAYTDPDCTQSTDGKDDLSVFYLRTNGSAAQRWNTDAAESSAGDPESTDRGRTGEQAAHRAVVPTLDIPKLTSTLYASLKDEHKNRITHYSGVDRFISTADRCAPVLIGVYTGQELHDENPAAQSHYDSHNFIELVYSEPVDIGGLPPDALNERVNATFNNPGEWGGAITSNGSGGLTITGYAEIASGTLETGSRASDNTAITLSDTLVHSLYRVFSLNPLNIPTVQTHRVRISIAGWVDDTVPINGIDHKYWPGFIDTAETPSGTVTVEANSNIKDSVGNELDHNSPPITVSGTGWDTSPPVIAKVVDELDNWASILGDDQQYEIMSMDIGASRVNYFELHAFDNTPEYSNEDDEDIWVFGAGWQETKPDESFLIPDTRGGIRGSSLHGSLHAFSYEEVGSSFSPGTKSFNIDEINQTFSNPFFGDPSSSDISDVPYFRLYLEDADATRFPMITNFSLSYTAYSSSNPNGGFITDLAGNLMQDFKGLTVDRTPPSISMTLAPIGSDKLYVLFSKELNTDNLTQIQEGLSIEPSSGTIDFGSAPPIIKHNSILGTGLIFTLDRDIRFDDILNFNVIGSDLIVDKLGVNPMVDGTSHVLSDFALAGIDVLYGYDNRLELLGEGVLGNGEYSLRDFTGQKSTSNTMLTDTDITIATRLSADPDEVAEDLYMILDVDPLPLSVSTMFNENTDSSWRIWLPTVLPALAKVANPKANEVEQEDGTGAERNFIIPNDSNKSNSFNWKDGDEVEFFFRYGDGSSTGFTFDHDGNEETPEVPLYFFRLENPNDPTSVDLWRFKLSDITKQRGGITILNNVINSLKKEETILELDLKRAGNVTVHVLTLDGNIVKTLQRGRLNSGLHYFKWNGTNMSGSSVARGMYFIRVVGPDIDETRKVMVIKQ